MRYRFRNKIIFRLLLYPFSLLYGLIIYIRNFLYDHGIFASYDAGIPVISIGNLTAGGTGKTPMTIFLLDRLQKKYERIAMVSRGYGRKSSGALVVSDGKGKVIPVEQGGDEPVMIAREFPQIPVIVSEKRIIGIQMARELFDSRLIILDDAFQHRQVIRDVNIVLIDGQSDISGQGMLPAGDRREPLASLSRADVLIFTRTGKTDQNQREAQVRKWFAGPVIFSDYIPDTLINSVSGQSVKAEDHQGKRAFAFCGIARPETFFASLEQLNLTVAGYAVYNDHYSYTPADVQDICHQAEENQCDFIITTTKDLVKLMPADFGPFDLFTLRMQLQLDETKLLQIVDSLIDKT